MAKASFKTVSTKGSYPDAGDGEDNRLTPTERQFANTSNGDPTGGNMSGGSAQEQPLRLTVQPFQGRSGQSDNQSTNRPKGST